MRKYHQLTSGERYELSALRKQGYTQRAIARSLRRAPSTISREVRRNAKSDGWYRPGDADDYARWRRSRSRRNRQFGWEDWALVVSFLEDLWSPEQVSGRLKRARLLWISHETIYRYIWADKRAGGTLYDLLRQRMKQRRKRYRSKDSRGRLPGRRAIT